MAQTSSRPSSTGRPYNLVILLTLLATGLVGFYLTMFETAVLNGIPVGYHDIVKAGRFPNGVHLVRSVTGLKGLDAAIAEVSASFLPSALGWDLGITLQASYFIVQFTAMLAVGGIEGHRARNVGSLLSWQVPLGIAYQTLSGALTTPMTALFALLRSGKDSWYTSGGRAVPLSYAKGLWPAIVLGYVLPTVALYYPVENVKFKSVMAVLWQPAPLYPALLLWIFSLVAKRGATSDRSAGSKHSAATADDVPYLKTTYKALGAICLISHLLTLYSCFSSPHPTALLRHMFIPDSAKRMTDIASGIHYIFQFDSIFCALGSLIWALVSVADIKRLSPDSTALSPWGTVWEAVKVIVMSAIVGPGTVLCIVWSWREDKLVLIEQSSVKGKTK